MNTIDKGRLKKGRKKNLRHGNSNLPDGKVFSRSSRSGGDGPKKPLKSLKFGGDKFDRNRKLNRIRRIEELSRKRNKSVSKSLDCSIWLDTNDTNQAVKIYSSLVSVLEEYGFEVESEEPPLLGSWFKNFKVNLKRKANSHEVHENLAKIKRGIELEGLDVKQSQVNKNNSEAVKNLAEAFKDLDFACANIGSLLIAKITIEGKPILRVEELIQEELDFLNRNSDLRSNPMDMINALDKKRKELVKNRPLKKLAQ